MAALFGIHVGNSSACLAICKDEDRVDIIANDAGERVTPTIVQWTPNNCIVGRAAQLEQFRHTTCTIIRNKQLLNDALSQAELDDLKRHIAYKINKNDSSLKYELLFDGKQHHVSPKDVAAHIFKKIYGIAESAVGANKELNAVITVPLYYSSKSIDNIKDVATKAGFNVVQVIDEPSAAALACGLGLDPEEQPCHCLVYRVGGVSLDATVLLVQGGMFTVCGSVHNYSLGGSVLTEKLAEFLASEFKRQYRGAELTERGKYKLFAAAENVKLILSIQNLAQCSAESVGSGYDLNCSVSRARFENIISSCINDIIAPITEVLKQTGLNVEQINKVVFCGGSLKIPKLQEAIKSLLPSAEILLNSGPDELMTMGAAKQAGYCTKYEHLPDTLSVDAPSLSTGFHVIVKQEKSEKDVCYTVHAKTAVPFRKRYDVQCAGTSLSVQAEVNEKNNSPLVVVSLDELEPQSMVRIDVDVNKDGKLLLTLSNEANNKKSCSKCDLNDIVSS